MTLPLVMWPDPRLSEICAPVEAVDDQMRQLAADMLATMYDAYGRGLAGPQVGAMQRIFVMDATWKEGDREPLVMINPVVIAHDGSAVMTEACLSIPDFEAALERPAAVTVQWTSETGEIHMNDFDGPEARIIQHELDHLNGRVILDHTPTGERR